MAEYVWNNALLLKTMIQKAMLWTACGYTRASWLNKPPPDLDGAFSFVFDRPKKSI